MYEYRIKQLKPVAFSHVATANNQFSNTTVAICARFCFSVISLYLWMMALEALSIEDSRDFSVQELDHFIDHIISRTTKEPVYSHHKHPSNNVGHHQLGSQRSLPEP
jgi:hypothetical protein